LLDLTTHKIKTKRMRYDCVPWFLTTAVHHFACESTSVPAIYGDFADAIDANWRQSEAFPLVTEEQAVVHFTRVIKQHTLKLEFWIEKFRNIPLDLYFDRAQELFASGCFLGLGYRSRLIFGTTGDYLHVSTISSVGEAGVKLLDHEIEGDQIFSWEAIEAAALSADGGFWIVSTGTK
jgi:hypothetical protein